MKRTRRRRVGRMLVEVWEVVDRSLFLLTFGFFCNMYTHTHSSSFCLPLCCFVSLDLSPARTRSDFVCNIILSTFLDHGFSTR